MRECFKNYVQNQDFQKALFSAPVADELNLECCLPHIAPDLLFATADEPRVALCAALGEDPVPGLHRDLEDKAGPVPVLRGFLRVLLVGGDELHDLVGGTPRSTNFLKTK